MTIAVPGYMESIFAGNLPNSPAGLTVDPTTGALIFTERSPNGILNRITLDRMLTTVTGDFTPTDKTYPFSGTDLRVADGFAYTVLSNGIDGELVRIDLTTGATQVLTSLPGFTEAGLDIVGNKLYITDGSGRANQLLEYDLSKNVSTPKIVNLPDQATGLKFDPARNRMYFAVAGSTENSGFYVADLTTGTYRSIASTPTGAGNFTIDPNGNFLYARVADKIQRISVNDGSVITFKSGLSFDDTADLTFGRSSSGAGGSLYVANGNSILEIAGFSAPPIPGSIGLPAANFVGTNGDDMLPFNGTGNQGDDAFAPGQGRDYVNGGNGTDLLIVDYSRNPYTNANGSFLPAGIQSHLNSFNGDSFNGSFRAVKDNTGQTDEINFNSIERFHVIGTNAGDSIAGGNRNDFLAGRGGNDMVWGGDGNDTLNGGSGNFDQVDGGLGTDLLIVDYLVSAPTSPMGATPILESATNPSQAGGYAGYFRFYNPVSGQVNRVEFTNIERFQIEGSNGHDNFRGTIADDIINSRGGDDRIEAGSGNDTVNGGEGNDDLKGNEGNDTFIAGLGDFDRVDGGEGNDVLVVDYLLTAAANPMGSVPLLNHYVVANPSPAGAGSYSGYFQLFDPTLNRSHRVEFTNLERFRIEGSNGADNLKGTIADDTILGRGGKDWIDAQVGNDNLNGGDGDDNLNGGDGNDTLNGGIGSQDRVAGGAGSDLLVVDYLPNIAGNPMAPPLFLDRIVTATLGGSYSGFFRVYNPSSGQVNRVEFVEIERFQIEGSQGHDILEGTIAHDVINGRAGDDRIEALLGNDALNGGEGNDSLNGGEGNDTLNAGMGDFDRVDGGTGSDLLVVDYLLNTGNPMAPPPNLNHSMNQTATGSYSGSFQLFDPNSNSVNRVEFINIERFRIEGSNGMDSLMGTIADDIINGRTGDDQIEGLAGHDVLNGGSGNDQIRGGEGNDSLYAGTGSFDQVNGGMGIDVLVVDYLLNAVTDPNAPHPAVQNNVSATEPGVYSGSFQFYDIVTNQSHQVNFQNIERFRIEGSNGANYLRGTIADDLINGYAGADQIESEAGNDSLTGGSGDDGLNGGAGIDRVVESGDVNFKLTNTQLTGNGLDSLTQIEQAHLTGGNGNNLLDASTFTLGTVWLNGQAGNDTLRGGNQANGLTGGTGHDLLVGGMGNNTFIGVSVAEGAGKGEVDTLVGGGKADTFCLADASQTYYNDRDAMTSGNNDFALIQAFQDGIDRIRLQGSAANYGVGAAGNGMNGTAIFLKTSGQDELIAVVEGVSGLNLTSKSFVYV